MAKGSTNGRDPAVSFFFNDFAGGTMTLSRHQKGCYMDLLTAQFNCGHLSLDEIKTVLGSDFGGTWPTLQKKFKKDSNDLLFNERLEIEILKRKSFSKSRRENLSGETDEGDPSPHMGNGNGLGNEIEKRKLNFISEIKKQFSQKYPLTLLDEFCSYWSEHSANGKKMRFEKEKVFDFSRRLSTWEKKADEFSKNDFKKANGFPNQYNKEFESKCTSEKMQEYWKHLRSIGLVPKKHRDGTVLDWVTPDQLQTAS